MSLRSLEQGIALIQQGNRDEGGRMIRIALKSEELQGTVRATALLWLAETTPDQQEKLALYQEALNHEPENAQAKARIAQLLAAGLQPSPAMPTGTQPITPQPTPPAGVPGAKSAQKPDQQPSAQQVGYGNFTQQSASSSPQKSTDRPQGNPEQSQPGSLPQQGAGFYRTAGITGGPNGNGTGFFVTKNGLLATTRNVTGNLENLTIQLDQGQQISGKVARSFPKFDLSFLVTGLQLSQILPASGAENLAANTPLIALAHNGQMLTGQRRSTVNETGLEWFPTTIDQLTDAGGNPIFDERNMLVGMLTANTSRTSEFVYGLSISVIYRLAEQYLREAQQLGQNQVYCAACGNLSWAGAEGGHYCETCGFTLPHAQGISRHQMPQMLARYAGNQPHPCGNCGSHEGFHKNKCLRCGYEAHN